MICRLGLQLKTKIVHSQEECNEVTLGMSNFAYKADDCNQWVGIVLALFWNIAVLRDL